MTVVPIPGVKITAFQSNAFQANAFQIGGFIAFQPGSKGVKHLDNVLWEIDDNFEEEHHAIAILLLMN